MDTDHAPTLPGFPMPAPKKRRARNVTDPIDGLAGAVSWYESARKIEDSDPQRAAEYRAYGASVERAELGSRPLHVLMVGDVDGD